ncbi:MAG: methanogenesis marker 3 protein [Methanosarcinaceae archaeon]|nr:methanogenesis marker 3 protein [Methanosarcinaceae archaeon]
MFGTTDEIKIQINGSEISLSEGSTLEDAIKLSKAPYRKGTAVGILIEKGDLKAQSSLEYTVRTSKGDFRIELDETPSPSMERWLSDHGKYSDLPVRWVSKDAIAFGPFVSDTGSFRGNMEFKAFELMFAAGGGDPDNTHLIFTRDQHVAEYGAPEEGTFAKVISGKHVLLDLARNDRILGIEPFVEWEQVGEHICTTDLSIRIEDGAKIFSYVGIEMDPEAPEGAEHLYAVTRDGTFKVDFVSSSFISDHRFQGELVTYENFEPRPAGSVFVRTVGYGAGKLFISTDDRTSTIMHSVVGHVARGLQLAKMATQGQRITVEKSPRSIMLPGMSHLEAESEMDARGVDVVREGYVEDDGFIVSQSPETTMDILAQGKVTLKGVDPEHLVKIELYDELVPKTLDFFRHATGMQYKPVGALPVLMTYENTYIFKAEKEAEKYKEILPENTPVSKVSAGEIGVTNQAARRAGMVGVKMEDSDLFGPTGEKFNSTNIIGKILEIEKLKNLRDGDIMYIVESWEEE